MTYTVVMLKEPVGGYSVLIPAFDDAATQGDDLGECLMMAQELIELLLDVRAEDGEAAPADVATVSFDMGDANEAFVCRVSVRERAKVA